MKKKKKTKFCICCCCWRRRALKKTFSVEILSNDKYDFPNSIIDKQKIIASWNYKQIIIIERDKPVHVVVAEQEMS